MTGHPIHLTASRAGCCLAVVFAVGLAGCSTTPSSHTDFPDRDGIDIQSRLSLDAANDVTLYAISLVGTPYRWSGNTPASGFDCSGLIGYVYKTRAGINAPRTTSALVDWGQPVPPAYLRSGDLVVFAQKGTVNHAGIYVGDGRFVHAPSSGGEVRLDSLSSIYWSRQPVSYRRP